ncbi:energy transducer TonB [Qipengyuania sp. SM2507]
MTLAGEPLERFSSSRDVITQFGPAGGEQGIRPFKGDVDGFGPALIYSGVNLEEKPDEDEDVDDAQASEIRTSLPAINVERAQGMEYIEIGQRNRGVRFATGPLDKPFAALNACSQDLLSAWGLDVDQHRSLTRMVDWTNSREITSRITRDYPMKALRRGEQGIVRALLLVNEKGAVEQCTLANATNSEALPAPACRALKDAVFEPALDSQGQPMRSFYITRIVYKMG